MIVDYKGQSATFKATGGSIVFIFLLGGLVVYLVLAAQFESWVHPFIIMLTVPLAIAGSLLGLYLSDMTLNVYSQIGLIMLVGLAAKNGILIVEYANQLRDDGREFHQALLEATEVRFRPIVMTGITTAAGSLPLLFALRPRLGNPRDDWYGHPCGGYCGDPVHAVHRACRLRSARPAHRVAAAAQTSLGARDGWCRCGRRSCKASPEMRLFKAVLFEANKLFPGLHYNCDSEFTASPPNAKHYAIADTMIIESRQQRRDGTDWCIAQCENDIAWYELAIAGQFAAAQSGRLDGGTRLHLEHAFDPELAG